MVGAVVNARAHLMAAELVAFARLNSPIIFSVTKSQKLFFPTPSSPYREFFKPVIRFKAPQCYFYSGSGEVLLAPGHFHF